MSLLDAALAESAQHAADVREPDEVAERVAEARLADLRAWYQEDAVWSPMATYGDDEA